ncbi:hypothetical protein [Mesorhizobium sp. M0091]|uniref:hypothetical protein n=1 Tax=Mesorhizobium sp. M0091 TaxID=2956875 RepID=UPI00333C6903
MLHHASFNARDQQAVASVLAEMLVATAVRAPSPPFPEGAWFVCLGDDFGSLIEILPCGTVLDQQAPLGIGFDPNMRLRSGSHVLLSTPNSTETIQGIAARMGWHSELIDARLFKVLKVWVEDETGRIPDARDRTAIPRDIRLGRHGDTRRQAARAGEPDGGSACRQGGEPVGPQG